MLRPPAVPARGFSYVSEPEQDFVCSVCLEPFDLPICHSYCGNIFCRNCISKLAECPVCRVVGLQSNLVTVPKLITNKLDSLLVSCDTCGVVQERGTIQQHMASHQQTSVVAAGSIEQLKQRINDLERRLAAAATLFPAPTTSQPAPAPCVRYDGVYKVAAQGATVTVEAGSLIFDEDWVCVNGRELRKYSQSGGFVFVDGNLQSSLPPLPRLNQGEVFIPQPVPMDMYQISDDGTELFHHGGILYRLLTTAPPIVGTTVITPHNHRHITFLEKNAVRENRYIGNTQREHYAVAKSCQVFTGTYSTRKKGALLQVSIEVGNDPITLYSFGIHMLQQDKNAILWSAKVVFLK